MPSRSPSFHKPIIQLKTDLQQTPIVCLSQRINAPKLISGLWSGPAKLEFTDGTILFTSGGNFQTCKTESSPPQPASQMQEFHLLDNLVGAQFSPMWKKKKEERKKNVTMKTSMCVHNSSQYRGIVSPNKQPARGSANVLWLLLSAVQLYALFL